MDNQNYEKMNNVAGRNQVGKHVYMGEKTEGTPRIMIVGNSITLHAPKADIGWYGNWGMAASAPEKDYVHVFMSLVREKYPDAVECVVQAAVWETTYRNCDYEGNFSEAKSFKPDVILCSLSANIPDAEFEEESFIKNLKKLHDFLSDGNDNVKIIEGTSFFNNKVKTEALRKYREKYGIKLVEISDIVEDEENLAIGKFEHKGIQYHPGDKGMEELAKRYFKAFCEVM